MNYYNSSPRPVRQLPENRSMRHKLLFKSLAGLVVLAAFAALFFHKPVTSHTAAQPPEATKPAFNACRNNGAGQTIIVSISKQHLWACNGAAEVKESPVTTGTTIVRNGVNDSTPIGTWTIQAKYRNLHLRGADANGSWDDPVQYWMPFDQADGIGFHDASWQTFPFGSSEYHTDGSHGCVHLPTDFIAWLYEWAPIGTHVVTET